MSTSRLSFAQVTGSCPKQNQSGGGFPRDSGTSRDVRGTETKSKRGSGANYIASGSKISNKKGITPVSFTGQASAVMPGELNDFLTRGTAPFPGAKPAEVSVLNPVHPGNSDAVKRREQGVHESAPSGFHLGTGGNRMRIPRTGVHAVFHGGLPSSRTVMFNASDAFSFESSASGVPDQDMPYTWVDQLAFPGNENGGGAFSPTHPNSKSGFLLVPCTLLCSGVDKTQTSPQVDVITCTGACTKLGACTKNSPQVDLITCTGACANPATNMKTQQFEIIKSVQDASDTTSPKVAVSNPVDEATTPSRVDEATLSVSIGSLPDSSRRQGSMAQIPSWGMCVPSYLVCSKEHTRWPCGSPTETGFVPRSFASGQSCSSFPASKQETSNELSGVYNTAAGQDFFLSKEGGVMWFPVILTVPQPSIVDFALRRYLSGRNLPLVQETWVRERTWSVKQIMETWYQVINTKVPSDKGELRRLIGDLVVQVHTAFTSVVWRCEDHHRYCECGAWFPDRILRETASAIPLIIWLTTMVTGQFHPELMRLFSNLLGKKYQTAELLREFYNVLFGFFKLEPVSKVFGINMVWEDGKLVPLEEFFRTDYPLLTSLPAVDLTDGHLEETEYDESVYTTCIEVLNQTLGFVAVVAKTKRPVIFLNQSEKVPYDQAKGELLVRTRKFQEAHEAHEADIAVRELINDLIDSVVGKVETFEAPVEAPVETFEAPVEAPVVETPVVETPVVEIPVVETPVAPAPVAPAFPSLNALISWLFSSSHSGSRPCDGKCVDYLVSGKRMRICASTHEALPPKGTVSEFGRSKVGIDFVKILTSESTTEEKAREIYQYLSERRLFDDEGLVESYLISICPDLAPAESPDSPVESPDSPVESKTWASISRPIPTKKTTKKSEGTAVLTKVKPERLEPERLEAQPASNPRKGGVSEFVLNASRRCASNRPPPKQSKDSDAKPVKDFRERWGKHIGTHIDKQLSSVPDARKWILHLIDATKIVVSKNMDIAKFGYAWMNFEWMNDVLDAETYGEMEKDACLHLGKRIREYLLEAGISQTHLSDLMLSSGKLGIDRAVHAGGGIHIQCCLADIFPRIAAVVIFGDHSNLGEIREELVNAQREYNRVFAVKGVPEKITYTNPIEGHKSCFNTTKTSVVFSVISIVDLQTRATMIAFKATHNITVLVDKVSVTVCFNHPLEETIDKGRPKKHRLCREDRGTTVRNTIDESKFIGVASGVHAPVHTSPDVLAEAVQQAITIAADRFSILMGTLKVVPDEWSRKGCESPDQEASIWVEGYDLEDSLFCLKETELAELEEKLDDATGVEHDQLFQEIETLRESLPGLRQAVIAEAGLKPTMIKWNPSIPSDLICPDISFRHTCHTGDCKLKCEQKMDMTPSEWLNKRAEKSRHKCVNCTSSPKFFFPVTGVSSKGKSGFLCRKCAFNTSETNLKASRIWADLSMSSVSFDPTKLPTKETQAQYDEIVARIKQEFVELSDAELALKQLNKSATQANNEYDRDLSVFKTWKEKEDPSPETLYNRKLAEARARVSFRNLSVANSELRIAQYRCEIARLNANFINLKLRKAQIKAGEPTALERYQAELTVKQGELRSEKDLFCVFKQKATTAEQELEKIHQDEKDRLEALSEVRPEALSEVRPVSSQSTTSSRPWSELMVDDDESEDDESEDE